MLTSRLKSANIGSVSTAWDIGYAYADVAESRRWELVNAEPQLNVTNITFTQTTVKGMYINATGTKLYVAGNGVVAQYSFGTAWNCTTLINDSTTFSVSGQDATPTGLFFNSDGTKMYIMGSTTDSIYEYNLSVAWNITTASLNTSLNITAVNTSPYGLYFRNDGLKMYWLGRGSDTIYEYTLSTAWSLSTASLTRSQSISAMLNPETVWFKPDGKKVYIVEGANPNNIFIYNLSTAWDVSTMTLSDDTIITSGENNPAGVWASPDAKYWFLAGATRDSLLYILNGGFSVTAQESSPTGITFKPDGTAMFIIGSSSRTVVKYILSTPWDVFTATFNSSYSTSTQDLTPEDIYFKSDGLVMYTVGRSNDRVYQYALSTAWDVTTTSYVNFVSVSAQAINPSGLDFSSDGTKMYVTNSSGTVGIVYQYALSTAWNVTTATFTKQVNFALVGGPIGLSGVKFKPDGTKMYLIGEVFMAQFNLSTPWDIATASYQKKFEIFSTRGYGFYFNPDGAQFFIIYFGTKDQVIPYKIGIE